MSAGMSVRADIWQQVSYINQAEGPFDSMIAPGGDTEAEELFRKVEETFDEVARVGLMRDLNKRIVDLAWQWQFWYTSAIAVAEAGVQHTLFADGKPHMGLCDVQITT
jgi:hypothetical protein